MNTKPRVVVVIPVYNREAVLARAVESVLNQTYKNFMLYIVDDASTDESLNIAINFKKNHPEQVEVISLPKNLGVSGARNSVLKTVDADFYALLDSDDEWLSKKLEEQIELQRYSKLKVIHTEEIWIRNGKRVNQMKKHKKSGGWILADSLEMCKMSPSSILIAKEVFKDVGYFREDFEVCEDFDLWLRICHKYEVAFVEEPQIYKYGGHEDQLSRKFHSMDCWRVKSLISLMENENLEAELSDSVRSVVVKKSTVLGKGFVKYGKLEQSDYYNALVSKYS